LKNVGLCNIRDRFVGFKKTMRTIAASMNNTFWNALMIKVKKFLTKMSILLSMPAARALPERILIISNGRPLLRC